MNQRRVYSPGGIFQTQIPKQRCSFLLSGSSRLNVPRFAAPAGQSQGLCWASDVITVSAWKWMNLSMSAHGAASPPPDAPRICLFGWPRSADFSISIIFTYKFWDWMQIFIYLFICFQILMNELVKMCPRYSSRRFCSSKFLMYLVHIQANIRKEF